MQKLFLGCDWGTSSFRLRLFDITSQQITGEVISEEGIAKMHNSWLALIGQNKNVTKAELFRSYLKDQIAVLSRKCLTDLDHVSIVISGMASSSIGMEDIPYAKVPFALDGSETAVKQFDAVEDFPHEIILVSGVCTENDVMRGEETQLIGVLKLLEQPTLNEAVLIFPGTHSKHIHIKENKLVGFKTFMTGELFNLVSNHSILKASVQKDDGNSFSESDANAFKHGLDQSKETGILNALFTVRTNQLFKKFDKKQNAFYLSGLLIGEELNYLAKNEELPLIVCSGSNLYRFYKQAVEELGVLARATIVSTDVVDKAAMAGQYLIFQKRIQ